MILPDGTAGYTLDAFGGLHGFSIGSNHGPFTANEAPYWSNWQIPHGATATL